MQTTTKYLNTTIGEIERSGIPLKREYFGKVATDGVKRLEELGMTDNCFTWVVDDRAELLKRLEIAYPEKYVDGTKNLTEETKPYHFVLQICRSCAWPTTLRKLMQLIYNIAALRRVLELSGTNESFKTDPDVLRIANTHLEFFVVLP